MNKNQIIRLKYLTILLVFLLTSFAVNAQEILASRPGTDSTTIYHDVSANDASSPVVKTHIKRRAERLQLLHFLKALNVPDVPYNESDDKQWNHLANLFTRLRLYPLAMKCFLKTMPPDSLVSGDIPITNGDQQTLENQLNQISYEANPLKCNIIKVDNILATFNDGKQALAYALILHVKQPVRGKATVHKFINTGHTFITLIKFNTDSSYAALTFGFGPHKDNLLAATPLLPASSSKFTDDGGHLWDEVVGKFISRRRFEKILQLTRHYDGLPYNLSTNNCTDFGLKAAQLAGLEVLDTKGSWPLGYGNNPGIAGESILLGKFSNKDTGSFGRLFIDTTYTAPAGHSRQFSITN